MEKQVVKTPSVFEIDEEFNDERFMKIRIAAMHSGENINHSDFSKETILDAKELFSNIPILANVVIKTDEDGNETLDYSSHDFHVEDDKFNDGKYKIIYDEKVVGVIPENNNFELVLDDETGNYYVWVDGLIYREYGNYCADILESRGGVTSVSMEIEVPEESFDAKRNVVICEKMIPCGVTLLGEDVNPGMKKAHATIFSNNSEDELKSLLKELNSSLEIYNKSKVTGGETVTKFEELLKKYDKTAEDITFEVDNLDDEALENAFKEAFDEDVSDATGDSASDSEVGAVDDESTESSGDETNETDETNKEVSEESETTDTVENTEETFESENTESETQENKKFTKTFELSYDDIQVSLYNLLEKVEAEDNTYYYIMSVFDDYFIYCGSNNQVYKQKYTKNEDVISFNGERIHVNIEYLTDDELSSLKSMRNEFSKFEEVSEKLAKYEAEPKKMEIINSDEYSSIRGTEEYQNILSDHFELDLQSLSEKLDEIVLSYAKANKLNFTVEKKDETVGKKLFGTNPMSETSGRYGNLFKK